MGAEVVVVVVRLEGVLHEPDEAARAPGAAAAPGPGALLHVAGHGPGRLGGPAASAGSARLTDEEIQLKVIGVSTLWERNGSSFPRPLVL